MQRLSCNLLGREVASAVGKERKRAIAIVSNVHRDTGRLHYVMKFVNIFVPVAVAERNECLIILNLLLGWARAGISGR
jgi:hypothetical protein